MQAKQPFTQYACEHGLSRYTLYVAHKQMEADGVIAPELSRPKKITRSAFVLVAVASEVNTLLTVRLPNGLALQFERVDAPLLSLLAAWPCLS